MKAEFCDSRKVYRVVSRIGECVVASRFGRCPFPVTLWVHDVTSFSSLGQITKGTFGPARRGMPSPGDILHPADVHEGQSVQCRSGGYWYQAVVEQKTGGGQCAAVWVHYRSYPALSR